MAVRPGFFLEALCSPLADASARSRPSLSAFGSSCWRWHWELWRPSRARTDGRGAPTVASSSSGETSLRCRESGLSRSLEIPTGSGSLAPREESPLRRQPRRGPSRYVLASERRGACRCPAGSTRPAKRSSGAPGRPAEALSACRDSRPRPSASCPGVGRFSSEACGPSRALPAKAATLRSRHRLRSRPSRANASRS